MSGKNDFGLRFGRAYCGALAGTLHWMRDHPNRVMGQCFVDALRDQYYREFYREVDGGCYMHPSTWPALQDMDEYKPKPPGGGLGRGGDAPESPIG